MHLSLRDQELNHTYIEIAVYKPHGNHKPQIYIRYTHTHTHTHTKPKIERKELEHNTKASHQITREDRKRKRNE